MDLHDWGSCKRLTDFGRAPLGVDCADVHGGIGWGRALN